MVVGRIGDGLTLAGGFCYSVALKIWLDAHENGRPVFIPRNSLAHRFLALLYRIFVADIRRPRQRARRRSHTCSQHDAVNCRDGFGGRFEISYAVTFRYFQRRPAVFILVIPDFDFGTLVGQELYNIR